MNQGSIYFTEVDRYQKLIIIKVILIEEVVVKNNKYFNYL